MISSKFRLLKNIFFLCIFCFNTDAISTEYQQQPGDFDYDYIFEQGSVWIDKDIITKKDPSSFISLEFIEKKEIEWWDQRTWKVNKRQYENINKKIFFDVFVFRAFFKKSHDILIRVNSEFKTQKKAEKQAATYAKIYGQMPNFLKERARSLTIHKGDIGWLGGNNDVIIYSNLSKAHSEEAMFHELAHVSLDFQFGGSVNENAWRNSILQDKYYITSYAYEYFFQEDIAETALWWFATRCKPNTISKKNYNKVIKNLPNRFEYLDDQDYDFYPSVCN
tara:strand:+ start:360 stop:1193 length:834 start_codon:yes stop_codon:yes gene_type:complete